MSDGNNEKMIRYLWIVRVYGKHIANFCFSPCKRGAFSFIIF